jgi:hypothetical protein
MTVNNLALLFHIGGTLLCLLVVKIAGFSIVLVVGWFFGCIGGGSVKHDKKFMPSVMVLMGQASLLSIVYFFCFDRTLESIVTLLIGYVLAFLSIVYITKIALRRNPANS